MFIIIFLFKVLTNFYISILILYSWMQKVRCNFYNPLIQYTIKIIKKFIKFKKFYNWKSGNFDISILFIALLISLIKFPIILILEKKIDIIFYKPFLFIIIGFIVFIKNFGTLIFWISILYSIFSINSYMHKNIYIILYQLIDPFIYPIKKFLLKIGLFDCSSFIFITILQLLNYLGEKLFSNIWINV
ncbi:YggT family protein [Sodalis-like secondary symbiont of Drepanosiphum platanoidis]|uniref:YggT family protein n=1 Tax=Sodalis-like secondary symbiont of Drepanosiphum platanoidis TaxID=2994493 RepID=UPI0034643D90